MTHHLSRGMLRLLALPVLASSLVACSNGDGSSGQETDGTGSPVGPGASGAGGAGDPAGGAGGDPAGATAGTTAGSGGQGGGPGVATTSQSGAGSGGAPATTGTSTGDGSSSSGGVSCAGDCFETGCAAGLACVAGPPDGCGACDCALPVPVAPVDPARSLYVSELEAVSRFDLQRVLERLLESAGATSQTPVELYRQWWDLNADAATGVTSGPHCEGTLNGYPLQCPRDEAQLAGSDPFSPAATYTTVGVVNRFDKVPLDGSSCGQYRVSFNLMREIQGADPDFNYFIIEAVMPNPRPDLGARGCLPLAKFWFDLTSVADRFARADALETLYFEGLPGFPPVLTWEHVRGALQGSGQIRSNQFLNSVSGQMWQLREYHLERSCDGDGECSLAVRMDTVKDNPFGLLFRTPGSAQAPSEAAAFQAWFLTQVGSLAASDDVNDLVLPTPEVWNAGESTEPGFLGRDPEDFWNDYAMQAEDNAAFLAQIQGVLQAVGSDLTPRHILDRATATSCAGCHQIATLRDLGHGITHPDSLRFVHTDETRGLSPALSGTFLPRRAATLEAYLNTHCGSQPVASPSVRPPPTTARFARSLGGGLALGH